MRSRSGIKIDPFDHWIYQGLEIVQPDILSYFRQNLHRDHCYYIHNQFGALIEQGDLDEVKGFPIHATSATLIGAGFKFLLDSEEYITIPFEAILASEPDCLFFEIPERRVPVRLKASAMTHASNSLEERDDQIYWTDGTPLRTARVSDYIER